MTLGRNAKRTRERHARNFGAEADAVRGMPCACLAKIGEWRWGDGVLGEDWALCKGAIEPAHIVSRGAGGGRFDIVPFCSHHHADQHQHGIRTLAAGYGLDLRAEADRVALGHERPLGIRGLADRWTGSSECGHEHERADSGQVVHRGYVWGVGYQYFECTAAGPALDTYETDALRGWLVRRMAIDFATLDNTTHADRDGLVELIEAELIEAALDIEDAWALCEWAGWPS